LDRINKTLSEGLAGGEGEVPEGAVEGAQSVAAVQAGATQALADSGATAAVGGFAAGIAGIGVGFARTMPNTLGDEWPLLIGTEYFDVNRSFVTTNQHFGLF